jgi:hypothetical protein
LTRTTGSRSHGPDQTALDLILGVHLRSNGTGQKERKGGRRCDAGGNTRGGVARDSPQLGVPAALGVKTSRLQAREHRRGTGKRSRATGGPRGARASRSIVRGGGHRRRAAFQGLRPAKDYGVRCKRTREMRGGSPRARGGRSCRGKWSSTMAVRRRRRRSRRMAVPRWPGPLGCGIRSGRLLR